MRPLRRVVELILEPLEDPIVVVVVVVPEAVVVVVGVGVGRGGVTSVASAPASIELARKRRSSPAGVPLEIGLHSAIDDAPDLILRGGHVPAAHLDDAQVPSNVDPAPESLLKLIHHGAALADDPALLAHALDGDKVRVGQGGHAVGTAFAAAAVGTAFAPTAVRTAFAAVARRARRRRIVGKGITAAVVVASGRGSVVPPRLLVAAVVSPTVATNALAPVPSVAVAAEPSLGVDAAPAASLLAKRAPAAAVPALVPIILVVVVVSVAAGRAASSAAERAASAASAASARAGAVVFSAVVEAVVAAPRLSAGFRRGAVAVLDDPKAARRARDGRPARGRARRGANAMAWRGGGERAAVKRDEHGGLHGSRRANVVAAAKNPLALFRDRCAFCDPV